MSFDIDNPGFQQSSLNPVRNTPSPSQEPSPIKNLVPTQPQDDISSSSFEKNAQSLSSPATSSTPSLSNSGVSEASLSSQINNIIKENQLPTGKDLFNNISEDTKKNIDKALASFDEGGSFSIEMKKFFSLLSKLYPLSLSILAGILKNTGKLSPEEIIKETLKSLNEQGKALEKQIGLQLFSPKTEESLKGIAKKLSLLSSQTQTNLKNGEVDSLLKSLKDIENRSLSKQEANALSLSLKESLKEGKTLLDDNSPLFRKLKELGLLSNKSATEKELQQILSSLEKKEILSEPQMKLTRSIKELLETFKNLNSLPEKERMLSFTAHLAMLHISKKSSPSGLLGPKVQEFSQSFSTFLLTIQKNLAISLQNRRGLYETAFSQTILTAAILGRMLADSKMSSGSSDDNTIFSTLKLHSAKDLGLLDQIPFSFLAFFPDLTNREDDFSDASKEAKKSLLHLIRILLRLIFILAAIVSFGTKVGKERMNALLKEASGMITGLLNDLIFALKKLDEHYVVSINIQAAFAQQAKDALALKNYPEFWSNMLHMFSEKTELASFLKDMKDAEPLFQTVESMMKESDKTLPLHLFGP